MNGHFLPDKATTAPALRELVADAVEALLALLDVMDGDADLEPECWDEGAQCDDEGEVDQDGFGVIEWTPATIVELDR